MEPSVITDGEVTGEEMVAILIESLQWSRR